MTLVEVLKGLGRGCERPFPDAEYDRRKAEVRKLMEADGIDALIISNSSNMAYLTGYDTSMPSGYSIMVLPLNGEPFMHSSGQEATCMFYSGDVTDIAEFDWYASSNTAVGLAQMIAERGLSSARFGVEMGYPETYAIGALDTKSYLTLKEKFPSADFVDATNLVLEVRLRKTDQEIAYMRRAGEFTWIGLQAAIEATHVGATDNEVMAAASYAMTTAGSELFSIDPMVMSGPRCGWMPHLPYKNDRIGDGDPLYVEMSGCHNRYNAPSIRTIVPGTPSDDLRRVHEHTNAILNALLEGIRPGRTGHDVAMEAKVHIPDDCFFQGTYGYSIGMGLQPSWTENPVYIAEGADRELEAGMAFHLVGGTLWKLGEPLGTGCSEAVVVTEDGCECLTPHKRAELIVVDA